MDTRVEGFGVKCFARVFCVMRDLAITYAVRTLSVMMVLGMTSIAMSQSVALKIPFTVKDNVGNVKTLYFGVHPSGTYCQDTDTLKNFCTPGSIYEASSPPLPFPDVFDARFQDPRGFNADCMDQGLESDIRPFTDTTDIDTFEVDFQNSNGYPFTLSWPSYLNYYCDSMRMKDGFNFGFINVNMMTRTSYQVTNTSFKSVRITMYGPHQWLCPPGPPALSTPSDNSVNISTSPALTWSPASGASQYRVQVATDSLFTSSVILDDTVNIPSQSVTGLSQIKKYYWRVAAINVIGVGDFSSPFRFTTQLNPPNTPTLVSPATGTAGLTTSPTLKWNKTPLTTNYRLQVSTDQTFATTAYDDATLTDTVKQVTGLSNCAQYYWRVLASNSSGPSAFSLSNNFTVQPAVPAVPVPVSPANNAIDIGVNPTTLTWSNDFCADTDTLQVIAGDSTSTSYTFYDAVTGTSKQLNGLAQNALYYWRVKGRNNTAGSSSYSSFSAFTTVLLPPATPMLVSPPANVDTVASNGTFRWNSVPYATSYNLQISGFANFSSMVYNDSSLTDSVQQIPSLLTHCVVYYWRVKGLNAKGSGSFSASRSFTVIEAAPAAPTLVSPQNDTINVAEFRILYWSTSDRCSKIFRVQVAKDIAFSPAQKIVDDTTRSTSKLIGPLEPSTDYYWRVLDSNSTGPGPYAVAFHFKTTAVTTPPSPNLVYPPDRLGDVDRNPTLLWDSTSPRAYTYRLQVALDSNFIVLFVNDSTIPSPAKQIGPLLIGTKYYWHVDAKNPAGTSDFSQRREFTTLFPPDTPVVIYPFNGIGNVSVTTDFQWSVTSLATTYHVQIARDAGFTSLIFDDSTLTVNSTHLANPLFGSRPYYWRVRGKNSVGWGQWSPTAYFFTQITGFAQWVIPLAVSETGPQHDTVYFGVDPAATACIDPSLGEYELPPVQTGMFDARFVGNCLGEGLPYDIVRFHDYSQIDTFHIKFQPGIGSYPFELSWPSDFIRLICDSMVIQDEFGGVTLQERMDLNSSAEVSNSTINELMIIKWGAKPLPTGVKPTLPEVPKGYVLFQNYPNPFNPSTIVQFSNDHSAQIKVVIYDILGKEVKELTDALYAPGIHEMSWNGRNEQGMQVPSGVYYVRMVGSAISGSFGKPERFSSVRKMVMLK